MTTFAQSTSRRNLANLSQNRRIDPGRLAKPTRRSSLTPDQRRRLEQLKDSPPDCMFDECFTEPQIEAKLFVGYDAVPEPDTSWVPNILNGQNAVDLTKRAKELAVLTKAQERECFLWFNYCRYRLGQDLDRYLDNPRRTTLAREVLRWDAKAFEARSRLTGYNLGLAIAMLKRLPQHVDRTEMLSEGYMALLRAIDKFDVGRGFKFSTYACNAIVKAYSRTGLKLEKGRKLAPYTFDPAMERSDWSEVKDREQREFCLERLNLVVTENGAKLDDLEMQILRERYHLDGADGHKPLTLREVGQMVNLTKERVRQIQIHALEKIRRSLEHVI
jgi:RNA polymerase sigma factor (sigma-70 family)